MLSKIRIFIEQLSISQKVRLILSAISTVFLITFLIVFQNMMSDLQSSVIEQNRQILSLICTDLDNQLDTIQKTASQIMSNTYVKRYIANPSSKNKQTLQVMITRNAFVVYGLRDETDDSDFLNTYDMFDLSGISGIMIVTDESYVCSDCTLSTQDRDALAACLRAQLTPGGNKAHLLLSQELYDVIGGLYYAVPLYVNNVNYDNTMPTDGYLILFTSRYFVSRVVAKYYHADTSVRISDQDGNTIWSSIPEGVLVDTQKQETSSFSQIHTDQGQILSQYNTLNNAAWTVTLQTPMSSITSQLAKYWILFFCAVLVITAAFFLMVSFFSRSITRRLTEMTDVINNIRKGDIDCRYPVVYHDDISLIGNELNRMVDQIQNYHLNAAMQELKQRESELHALQGNINPHFLYNSLDCIRTSALVNNDVRTAHQIQILANMFRYTVSTGNTRSETVTIEAELDHVYDYLSMLSFRFEDRYFVDITISNRILPLYTLKLILQPVIENAFHHGVRHMATGGWVRICGDLDEAENCVRFTVEDNGAGIPSDQLQDLTALLNDSPLSVRSGPFMALVNISDRIHIAYGKAYGLSVESTQGEGTRVTIRIPILREQGGGVGC